ncbi:hypothetical protein G3I40_37635, partial [Streptomyces sp. SID14478]|uniref:hypothetical protein n=1 Tax=Streptomyces sp. SID14478 TaxID=2706073 RepID=UPI0013E00186
PAAHQRPARARALPRRGVLTVGALGAAAVVAIAVPLTSGPDRAQEASPAPRHDTSTTDSTATDGGHLDIANADYALQSRPGGTVSVQLMDHEGVSGLQAALDKAGIPATVMVPSASCHATRPTDNHARGTLSKVVPPSGAHDDGSRDIKPDAIVPGDHLLLVPNSKTGPVSLLTIRLVRQLPTCLPAD